MFEGGFYSHLFKVNKEQDKVLCEVTDRLTDYGLSEEYVMRWWQMPMRKLNGYAPMHALEAEKFNLVKAMCEYTIKKIDEAREAEAKER